MTLSGSFSKSQAGITVKGSMTLTLHYEPRTGTLVVNPAEKQSDGSYKDGFSGSITVDGWLPFFDRAQTTGLEVPLYGERANLVDKPEIEFESSK